MCVCQTGEQQGKIKKRSGQMSLKEVKGER